MAQHDIPVEPSGITSDIVVSVVCILFLKVATATSRPSAKSGRVGNLAHDLKLNFCIGEPKPTREPITERTD